MSDGHDGGLRLFIGLLPPEDALAQVVALQQRVNHAHPVRRLPTSPPHITLYPPFGWPLAELPRLSAQLAAFAAGRSPLSIVCDGARMLPVDVLTIGVRPDAPLLALRAALLATLQAQHGITPVRPPHPFLPHITIARLDRRPDQPMPTLDAWPARFVVDALSLLRYDGARWQVQQRARLAAPA
jgi:2'-5' RNA ligase